MEPHHDTGFPTTLHRWIGEIVQSSPEAARLTLLELIVGALLASGGHVTQAILALTPRLGWQAYHWMLERGRFRLLGLISALCRIVHHAPNVTIRKAIGAELRRVWNTSTLVSALEELDRLALDQVLRHALGRAGINAVEPPDVVMCGA